jgi:hypothetical protein
MRTFDSGAIGVSSVQGDRQPLLGVLLRQIDGGQLPKGLYTKERSNR